MIMLPIIHLSLRLAFRSLETGVANAIDRPE